MAANCEHSACSFENRLLYCDIEAAEPDGAVSVVTEMLDALIYDSGPVTSDEYNLYSERESQTLTRTFSYLRGDIQSWVWPLIETELTVCHKKDKLLDHETYEVALAWRVEQIGASKDRFVTNYGIDVYPHGAVQAYIEESNSQVYIEQLEVTAKDVRTTRRMTTYDHEKLFDELSIIYDLHTAERGDNTQVLS